MQQKRLELWRCKLCEQRRHLKMVTESGISAYSVGRIFSRSHSVPSEPVDEKKTAKHRRRLHSDTAWHANEESVARQLKKGHSFPEEADEHPRERRKSRRKLV